MTDAQVKTGANQGANHEVSGMSRPRPKITLGKNRIPRPSRAFVGSIDRGACVGAICKRNAGRALVREKKGDNEGGDVYLRLA